MVIFCLIGTVLALTKHKFNNSEASIHNLFASVDIIAAINYYGVTELLDTIGEENIKAHLELDKVYLIDPEIPL